MRDSILAAAEKVFAREGQAGLSIRRLADEIDYSPAAIYKYFGSKDELIDELKESFFERILAQVHRIRDTELPFQERARDCVATYVRTALEKPHHYLAAFAGEASLPAESAAQSNKHQAFAALQDMVQEGVDCGAFRADLDPRRAAKSVWAASHGLALLMAHMPFFPQMRSDEAPGSRDDFIAFHADIVMRGLEK